MQFLFSEIFIYFLIKKNDNRNSLYSLLNVKTRIHWTYVHTCIMMLILVQEK